MRKSFSLELKQIQRDMRLCGNDTNEDVVRVGPGNFDRSGTFEDILHAINPIHMKGYQGDRSLSEAADRL